VEGREGERTWRAESERDVASKKGCSRQQERERERARERVRERTRERGEGERDREKASEREKEIISARRAIREGRT